MNSHTGKQVNKARNVGYNHPDLENQKYLACNLKWSTLKYSQSQWQSV